MITKTTGSFLLVFLTSIGVAQYKSGSELLKAMHTRYFEGPCKSYAFSQKNKHYRNDSVIKTSEWHEAVEFPDKFQILLGEKGLSNKILYRNDSMFNYRNGVLLRSRPDTNALLLFLGGMYYRSFGDVLERVKVAHYDVSVVSEQTWKGKPVYVLGAKENDLKSNQVWVDKNELIIVRIIEKLRSGSVMDFHMETHQKMCNGFIETSVSFRRDGKLEQVEEYYDIKQTERFSGD